MPKNCNSCANEYMDPQHKPHKLCRVCWEDFPEKAETAKWIRVPDTIINFVGQCNNKADNCPGWKAK